LLGKKLAFQKVFTHNDLLSGNVLVQRTESYLPPKRYPGDITIIDFEYAGYNARASDLANHFLGTPLTSFLLITEISSVKLRVHSFYL